MTAWLSTRPNLSVTRPRPATIGVAHIPATVIDIGIAPNAKNEDPGCPTTACLAFLTWPNAGTNIYGIGTPEVLRLYLSDVGYHGAKHLFAVAIEATSQTELETSAPLAAPVIKSASGPLTPG